MRPSMTTVFLWFLQFFRGLNRSLFILWKNTHLHPASFIPFM